MCRRNEFDTQTWLQDVMRDPRTAGALRRRIETLLADAVVARTIARKLSDGRAATAAQGLATLPDPCAADSPARPARDFILAGDDRPRRPRGDGALAGWLR
jgi:hypothetical protein